MGADVLIWTSMMLAPLALLLIRCWCVGGPWREISGEFWLWALIWIFAVLTSPPVLGLVYYLLFEK